MQQDEPEEEVGHIFLQVKKGQFLRRTFVNKQSKLSAQTSLIFFIYLILD